MKYFADSAAREASGHEDYIEFQLPTATVEFWDETSLYMSEEVLHESGFGDFWSGCMYDGTVFDMSSFSKAELGRMEEAAAKCGGEISEVIAELKAWVDSHLNKDGQTVGVCWASDRALAHRRAQREAYTVNPRFYEEVREMYERCKDMPLSEQTAVTEAAYEELLRKYNMPSYFFPFPLYEPDKWDV